MEETNLPEPIRAGVVCVFESMHVYVCGVHVYVCSVCEYVECVCVRTPVCKSAVIFTYVSMLCAFGSIGNIYAYVFTCTCVCVCAVTFTCM